MKTIKITSEKEREAFLLVAVAWYYVDPRTGTGVVPLGSAANIEGAIEIGKCLRSCMVEPDDSLELVEMPFDTTMTDASLSLLTTVTRAYVLQLMHISAAAQGKAVLDLLASSQIDAEP